MSVTVDCVSAEIVTIVCVFYLELLVRMYAGFTCSRVSPKQQLLMSGKHG